MANGRNSGPGKGDSGRDSGPFVALPWSVLDSPAYIRLSHPAKALLLELARQFVRNNNGRLLASKAYLSARGWTSSEVITRAKRELLAAGFIHETVKGRRPNKASWYAITWHALDKLQGFDTDAAETFQRGAYKELVPIQSKPTRDELYAKWRTPADSKKSARPSHGLESGSIGPSHGLDAKPVGPSHGPMRAVSALSLDRLPVTI